MSAITAIRIISIRANRPIDPPIAGAMVLPASPPKNHMSHPVRFVAENAAAGAVLGGAALGVSTGLRLAALAGAVLGGLAGVRSAWAILDYQSREKFPA